MRKEYHILETDEMKVAREKAYRNISLSEDNFVVIEDGHIVAVSRGSQYAGCGCAYDYVTRQCKYTCVRDAAKEMSPEDAKIVLAALEEAEKRDAAEAKKIGWRRISPKSMPKHGEEVLVTAITNNGDKVVYGNVRYNAEMGYFEVPCRGDAKRYGWESVWGSVTHWQPMPKPAIG